ncbi:MAG TPA: sulfatase-like hydrolase/transferase [Vicinamibacteria bacterium]
MQAVKRAVAVLSAAAALGACGRRAAETPPAPRARHLVLVTIDTLRADRLGVYGHAAAATPHLDRLAREGAMAPQATAHVPLTRPSHASILTGLHPAEHGLRDNVSPPLAAGVPTLAATLQAAGFRTAAFVSSIVLSAQSGLGRGFQTYSDAFETGGDDARFLNTIQKRGDLATGEAIAWLRAAPDERLFLWLHLYDPHDPYEPPEPYASRFAADPYDGEVAWSDELVGRLRQALEARGVLDRSLVIVTSDHGEGLGDHGESAHGFFAYESTLRVPLIVRGPGVAAGGRLGVTARGVDIAPTALDLLGVAPPPAARLSGRSLAAELRGGKMADAPAYAESLLPLLHYGWSDLRVLRDGRWKYIQAPRPELYDLAHDPGETANVAATEPARAEALRAALARRLEQERAGGAARASATDVPADLLEKLGALGYLGAGSADAGPDTGADPKDKLEDYKAVNRLMREGLVLLRRRDHAGSARRLRAILSRGIESFEVHYYLGRALMGQGRAREAAPHFESALARLPGYTAAYLELAEARAGFGDWEGALRALRDGQKASPTQASLFAAEAKLWRQRKRPAEAAAALRGAIERAPGDARLRVQAGELARDMGRLDEAARLLREAVEVAPAVASYWNSLGMVLGASGDLAGAEQAFAAALERDPANAEYAYNRGLALMRQGRAADAAAAFRRTLDLQPRFAPARERLGELGAR